MDGFDAALRAFLPCFASVHVALAGQDVRHVLALEPVLAAMHLHVTLVDPRGAAAGPGFWRGVYNAADLTRIKGDAASWEEFFQELSDATKHSNARAPIAAQLDDAARFVRIAGAYRFDDLALPGAEVNEARERVELVFKLLDALAAARQASPAEDVLRRMRAELASLRHRIGAAAVPGSADSFASSDQALDSGAGRSKARGTTLKRKANASVVNPRVAKSRRRRGARIAGSDSDASE